MEEIWVVKLQSGKAAAINPGLVELRYPEAPKILVQDDGSVVRTMEYGAKGYEPHRDTCLRAPKKELRESRG
jgi:hypothetical protein